MLLHQGEPPFENVDFESYFGKNILEDHCHISLENYFRRNFIFVDFKLVIIMIFISY